MVFSNFGIVNSFYENKGDKVTDLLGTPLTGEKDREAKFETYEMYSLKFDSWWNDLII